MNIQKNIYNLQIIKSCFTSSKMQIFLLVCLLLNRFLCVIIHANNFIFSVFSQCKSMPISFRM